MTMTNKFQHRHYAAIASVLADAREAPAEYGFTGGQRDKVLDSLEARLIRLFKADNYGFSADRFTKAARRAPDMHGKDKR